jgi:hypothetical protein
MQLRMEVMAVMEVEITEEMMVVVGISRLIPSA